jgi:hypothetical protein
MTPINLSRKAVQQKENHLKAAQQRLDNFTRNMMEVLLKFIEERQAT